MNCNWYHINGTYSSPSRFCLQNSLFLIDQFFPLFSWKVLIKQEIQRKSGYAIQVDEEHLRVQLDTIQSELNAPTQFKVSVSKLKDTLNSVSCFLQDQMEFISYSFRKHKFGTFYKQLTVILLYWSYFVRFLYLWIHATVVFLAAVTD